MYLLRIIYSFRKNYEVNILFVMYNTGVVSTVFSEVCRIKIDRKKRPDLMLGGV